MNYRVLFFSIIVAAIGLATPLAAQTYQAPATSNQPVLDSLDPHIDDALKSIDTEKAKGRCKQEILGEIALYILEAVAVAVPCNILYRRWAKKFPPKNANNSAWHNPRSPRYYVKLLVLLPLWALLLLFGASVYAVIHEIPTSSTLGFVAQAMIFVTVGVITKPLGFWRKAACCIASIAVYLLLGKILSFILSALLAAVIAFVVAGEVQLILQRRWRKGIPAVGVQVVT